MRQIGFTVTSSNEHIFRVTVSGEFPPQRPVMRNFDIFFDLRLNKRLSKHSWGWWFETLSCPLWRQCNESCLDIMDISPSCTKTVTRGGTPMVNIGLSLCLIAIIDIYHAWYESNLILFADDRNIFKGSAKSDFDRKYKDCVYGRC